LRNVIDGILKKVVADIKQVIEKTGRSFDRRIYESKQAKSKLEDQLRDVNFDKKKRIRKLIFICFFS
jgi:predicted house-cleaning noncanonical NTP pyrophosphatase (MazG superfamily)